MSSCARVGGVDRYKQLCCLTSLLPLFFYVDITGKIPDKEKIVFSYNSINKKCSLFFLFSILQSITSTLLYLVTLFLVRHSLTLISFLLTFLPFFSFFTTIENTTISPRLCPFYFYTVITSIPFFSFLNPVLFL